jgi:hypothetical protein
MTDLQLHSACPHLLTQLRAVLTPQIRAELVEQAERAVYGSDWFKRGVTQARKRKARPDYGSKVAAILTLLSRRNWIGAAEIANETGLDQVTVCQRLILLRKSGRIERRGERRRYQYAIAVPTSAQAAE